MAKLASNLYLLVHSLPQEERYDTDDASAGQVYKIFVPQSSLSAVCCAIAAGAGPVSLEGLWEGGMGALRATPQCGRQYEVTTFRRNVLLMRSLHWSVYRQTQASICPTPG